MSRVNFLDFSANKKFRKPFHYEREGGFPPSIGPMLRW